MKEEGSTLDHEPSRESESTHSAWGGSTIWSELLLAKQSNCPGAADALQHLCERYWRPVYAYIRGRGHDPTGAEDLTQDFFTHFLKNNLVERLDPSKGRFRSFLLVVLKNFLANEYDRAQAKKRGSGRIPIPLDDQGVEDPPTPGMSAEALYDRRWALNVLNLSMARLEAGETAAGRSQQFERLKIFLTVDAKDDNYEAAGITLGMTRHAVGTAVSRLKHRFRDTVREEIASTVTRPEQVEEELWSLKAALRSA